MEDQQTLQDYENTLAAMNEERESLLVLLLQMKENATPKIIQSTQETDLNIECAQKRIQELNMESFSIKNENRQLVVEKEFLSQNLPEK